MNVLFSDFVFCTKDLQVSLITYQIFFKFFKTSNKEILKISISCYCLYRAFQSFSHINGFPLYTVSPFFIVNLSF